MTGSGRAWYDSRMAARAGYDVAIVGGGSAGCALANRLTADPSTRVVVLEAGRPDWRFDVFIHMPAALPFPIGSRFYDWKYESEPEPEMHGRRIYHARGKVLGGSSSINGMIFQRGNPLDLEKWAADPGMDAWDYAHCLPYFKKMETCLAGADDWRGGDGPLVLERGPAQGELFDAFFAAVQQAANVFAMAKDDERRRGHDGGKHLRLVALQQVDRDRERCRGHDGPHLRGRQNGIPGHRHVVDAIQGDGRPGARLRKQHAETVLEWHQHLVAYAAARRGRAIVVHAERGRQPARRFGREIGHSR